MLVELASYLREQSAQPYSSGRSDCATLVADWVLLRRGVDPLAGKRGYSAAEAEDVLRVSGGIAPLFRRALRRAGLLATCSPVPGDVGIVAIDGEPHGAIRTERGWITRFGRGLASYPPERVRFVAAWAV